LDVEAMMVTSACVGWEAARASAPASGLVIGGMKVTECSRSRSCLLPLRLILSCDNGPCLRLLEAKSATDGYVIANIEHLMLWLLNGPMQAKGAHEE
jgi:hypothetical protein